jgi:hypothetical protein
MMMMMMMMIITEVSSAASRLVAAAADTYDVPLSNSVEGVNRSIQDRPNTNRFIDTNFINGMTA